jgi:CheY-like chemotaxis protein
MLPRAVILDAALPKMFGFQICEMVKRNESLCGIHVALIGSVHHPDRYRRPPNELYGADVYLERPDLLESLGAIVASFGYSVRSPAPAPAAPLRPEPVAPPPAPRQPAPAPTQARPVPAAAVAPTPAQAGDDGLAAERANAERLARIIVSDIALYQPELFAQGLEGGRLPAALEGAIHEGRNFFSQRVDARIAEERDYLTEELVRVVRERSGQ